MRTADKVVARDVSPAREFYSSGPYGSLERSRILSEKQQPDRRHRVNQEFPEASREAFVYCKPMSIFYVRL